MWRRVFRRGQDGRDYDRSGYDVYSTSSGFGQGKSTNNWYWRTDNCKAFQNMQKDGHWSYEWNPGYGYSSRAAGAAEQAAYGHLMRYGMAVALLGVAAVAACSPVRHPASSSPSHQADALPGGRAAPVSAARCLARRVDGPLPAWARSGFHPPDLPIGHVMGLRGKIVAILWGGPQTSLYAPPLPSRGNKVLWVPRRADQAAAPLTIRAKLNGAHRAVTRKLPDVGPSYVDLPAPGCWTLDLSWSRQRDQVELWYTPS